MRKNKMKKEKMNVTITLEVNKEDYELLEEWNFYTKKNLEVYIESAAKELREHLNKQLITSEAKSR